MKILLIEDDSQVQNYVRKGLEAANHNVDVSSDGKEGLHLANSQTYDAIILDRMLPSMDGLSILQSIREAKDETPVIILSALGEVDDRVKGLRAGGDDYLVKPFAFVELMARIEVLGRRSQPTNSNQVTKLSAADLSVDLITRKVERNGNQIDLQTREFNLLEYLLRNKGNIVTRTMLLEAVWNYHFDPQTNVIDVHISRLRKKIDDQQGKLIQTVRGAGYIIKD